MTPLLRPLMVAATIAAGAVVSTVALPAYACGASCDCKHGAEEKAQEKAVKTLSPDKKKAPLKAEEKKADQPAPATETQSSLGHDLDLLIAGKCNCTSAADCTCKKGDCACKKCTPGVHRPTVIFDSLKGENGRLVLPRNARNDATAGVFI